MAREKKPESERASSTFRDFFSLGAGVTPAEGSVKPTAGSHSISELQPRQDRRAAAVRLRQQHLHVADVAFAEAGLAVA